MLNYPDDVQKYPWLAHLFDTYNILDKGRPEAIRIEERRRGQSIACHKGCYICCTNQIILLTQIEYMGLSWYASEKIKDIEVRKKLKDRLHHHKELIECPFLIDDICSVYEVRPLACRAYYVFKNRCLPNEDMTKERFEDIFMADLALSKEAGLSLLKFYDFKSKKEREEAFEEGFILASGLKLHELPLDNIAETMILFDSDTDA